ncbi:MAG: signal recognition particle protein Srp19, partial [Candidatus Methanomethylicota archaeon]
MKKKKLLVIWPIYFNSKVSRKMGRKIPLNLAVEDPRIEEIVKIARELNLNPIIEEKAYPKMWWREKKRILVEKKMSKSRLLKEIAVRLRRN